VSSSVSKRRVAEGKGVPTNRQAQQLNAGALGRSSISLVAGHPRSFNIGRYLRRILMCKFVTCERNGDLKSREILNTVIDDEQSTLIASKASTPHPRGCYMTQGTKGIILVANERHFTLVAEVSVSEAMHKSIHAQVNASQRTKIQTPLGGQVNLPSQSVNPPDIGTA
jgi:hypothetical protein